MSKESYIAESEALNKLFNNMTQRKVDAAEKEKLKKEENKGEQVEAKKPLQAAPTTSRPIHSEYLEKKKKEEEEAKRIEEARRAKMRKQIEKEEAEKAEQERKLAEERKKQEAERKKKEEERLANLFGVTAKKEPKPQSNPAVKPATKDEPVKEESLPVKDESKDETTESKTKEALHVFETVLNKAEENEQGPKDAEPEQKKVAPVIAKPPVSEQISEQPKPPVIPAKDKKPVTDKTASAPEMKPEAKPVQKPVSQPAQRTESPQKGNSAIMARGQSGMQMEKPKTDKLSITGIVPMKSDRGSKYDSAMKASNAFRTNVFLTCVYNDETREGAYGIVVDMGDKRIIHGMCGHTSDEWEYGFAGAIEAMRICTENNVKEIMFVVLDPLCEILQQNADGLRWGYSYTRSQFTKAIDVLKREAAIGFIPEHVESEFQDLAETIAKTLVFPVND